MNILLTLKFSIQILIIGIFYSKVSFGMLKCSSHNYYPDYMDLYNLEPASTPAAIAAFLEHITITFHIPKLFQPDSHFNGSGESQYQKMQSPMGGSNP